MKFEIGDQVVFKGTVAPILRVVDKAPNEIVGAEQVVLLFPGREGSAHQGREAANMTSLTLAEPLMQWFRYKHLPDHLQPTSRMFADLASDIMETLPANPERTEALRKLLEAKDCGVRAVLYE